LIAALRAGRGVVRISPRKLQIAAHILAQLQKLLRLVFAQVFELRAENRAFFALTLQHPLPFLMLLLALQARFRLRLRAYLLVLARQAEPQTFKPSRKPRRALARGLRFYAGRARRSARRNARALPRHGG
jgi:hypothetical protein